MNIFVLDYNPYDAARQQCDKHVIKMILETAQLLSTASIINGGTAPYKQTHLKHPCTIWTAKSEDNYNWLVEHGLELCKEYSKRYNKIHKSEEIINWLKINGKRSNYKSLTDFAQAMPDQYKNKDAVIAYRNYYVNEKKTFATWKNPAVIPEWFLKGINICN
jgi:hypothetical protein